MELNQDVLLEDLLGVGRENWEANPTEINGFFSNTWGFNSFDENPASVIPNSGLGDFTTSIKPTLDCSFNEFYGPFGAKFMVPEMTNSSSYTNKLDTLQFLAQEDYSMSLLEEEEPGLQGDHLHSQDMQDACRVEATQSAEIPAFNVGLCMDRKNKVKRLEGQPSKNLMAERRRRKRLNDRLSLLRSVVPKISKMDRTSILGDTIDYMKELLERINNLKGEIEVGSSQLNVMSIIKDVKPNDVLVRNSPKFDVERRNEDTRIEICCAPKPGLLLSTVNTLEALGLEIQQCVISSFSDFSLQASCTEELEQRKQITSEDIKQALFRNAGYGGRCL
ncbi:Transcription factor bHLH93 [Ancistrocladus abbreviatus]